MLRNPPLTVDLIDLGYSVYVSEFHDAVAELAESIA